MTVPWFISHFIRENFDHLQREYSGQTVTFHFTDWDPRTHLLKNPTELNISIEQVFNDFSPDFFSNFANQYFKYYFPTDDEYFLFQEDLPLLIPMLNQGDFFNKSKNKSGYFISVLDTYPLPEIDSLLSSRIKVLSQSRKVFDSLINCLSARGPAQLLVLIHKYTSDVPINNIISGFQHNFDFLSPYNSDFFDFLIPKNTTDQLRKYNHDLFLKKALYYYPEVKLILKNVLYDPNVDLIHFYHGHILDAIEEDLPIALKDKIVQTIEIIEKGELPPGYHEFVKVPSYLEGLKTLKTKFIDPKPAVDSYFDYLMHLPSISDQVRDISVRYTDDSYILPITQFFKETLPDQSISFKERRILISFLLKNDFKNLSKLENIIKKLAQQEIEFYPSILNKLNLSTSELEQLLVHPAYDLRRFAGLKLGIEVKDMAKYLDQFMLAENFIPIIMYQNTPYFVSYPYKDLRIFEEMKSFPDNRFTIITPKKKVIELSKVEFSHLMDYDSHSSYKFKTIIENKPELELKFYLLIDEEKFGLSVAEILDIPNHYFNPFKTSNKPEEGGT